MALWGLCGASERSGSCSLQLLSIVSTGLVSTENKGPMCVLCGLCAGTGFSSNVNKEGT